MGHRTRIIRPDDLLNLDIEGVNLRLDQTDPAHPALVPEVPGQPAFLIYTFPPQTLAEQAFFESSATPPPAAEPPPARRPPQPEGDDPPPIPGAPVKVRLGGLTRLAFRVPSDAGARIAYATEALLDWSRFEPSLAPLAAVPAQPTPQEAEGAPVFTPPAPTDTVIELPYHLQLSPGANAAWQHAREPVSHKGWSELWHARLVTRRNAEEAFAEPTLAAPAPLRAIWSDEFNPNEKLAAEGMFDNDPEVGRTAMSALDRKQIVVLTSAFHGYVSINDAGFASRYLPQPIQCEQLMLSPLGGWLKSRGAWTPPFRQARAIGGEVVVTWRHVIRPELLGPEIVRAEADVVRTPGPQPFIAWGHYELDPPPLSLSEWVHVASQGRDHYVRIVYNGCLCGTRHLASLVKVTERRFRDVGGTAVAYLVQTMYVVLRQPEVEYANSGRSLPFKRVRMTTTITPPISSPTLPASRIPGTSSFWVMVPDPATGKPVDFMFHGFATDLAEHRIDFAAPLIFVPDNEEGKGLDAVLAAYRADGGGQRRAFAIPGQIVTFAPPDPGLPADNTTQPTERILLKAVPSTSTRCRFTPEMDSAVVRIAAVEQLLSKDTLVDIRLNADFVMHGFAGGTGVFADIVSGLDLQFAAAQAGGIATPNMNLTCLSRDHGPLAGDVDKAAAGTFDPAEFFPKGTAQLFGVIDLVDLLAPGGTITENAPKLEVVRENGGKKIVTTIEWRPALRDEPIEVGLLVFRRLPGSTLTITGRIEQAVGSGPTPPHTLMHGVLTSFVIEFAQVIRIRFAAFSFTSEGGQKPAIDVRLEDSDPIAFDGALEFVDELRKHIPPGLFGDGPSLDIDAQRIRAGFGIALPPLSVAVFSLRNVALSTGLELPFSNGQPAFDFSFAERHGPFQLAVAFLGGGGFFRLQVDTAGIRQLEAALEFGAVAALDIGVASGSVHIMAGIYFAMNRDKAGDVAAVLSGYLRCGGELSVLGIISISVEFNLSFTYDAGKKKATGRATLTVEVEIAFFSMSVDLTVERSFGRDGGDPTFDHLIEGPEVWREYAAAFA